MHYENHSVTLKNKQKNSKALFTLQQVVTDPIFPRIMGAKTAKEAQRMWMRESMSEWGCEGVRRVLEA